MDDKIAQDYSAWFSELEFLNRLLEQRSAAPRCRSEDDEKSLRGLAREHFEQKVLPHFKRYEERGASDSVTLREQEPWLVEFGRRTGTFQKSLEMFRRQPAQLSAALSSYTEIMYCGMILLCWRMDKPSTSSQNYSYLVPTHGMVTQSIPSCVSNTEADWKLAKYALAYDHFDSSSPWRDFVSWIGDFANIIGCSAPADERKLDAFSFVNAIQKKCFETDSSARETELQATINLLTEENAKLKETVREWTRMQAVLSFRHVLERLPSPSGKKAGESASWADFWKKAVEEATKPGAKNTELARIVKDYRKLRDDIKKSTEKPSENASKTAVEKATTALANPNENSTAQTTNEISATKNACETPNNDSTTDMKEISKKAEKKTGPKAPTADTSQNAEEPDIYDHAKVKNAGAGLYSTFSDNIHHYEGHYDLQQSQWHALEWRILKVLTPREENIDDGQVQWDRERLRFIAPIKDTTADTGASAEVTDP